MPSWSGLPNKDEEMLIPDNLLDRANDEPLEVGIEVCNQYIQIQVRNPFGESEDESLEVTKFFYYMKQAKLLDFSADIPEIINGSVDIASTHIFVHNVLEQLSSIQRHHYAIKLEEELEARFSKKIKNSFGYEFTEGDLKEIQALVNKLRNLIIDCSELDEEHRRRITKKLEQVQQELHKKNINPRPYLRTCYRGKYSCRQGRRKRQATN